MVLIISTKAATEIIRCVPISGVNMAALIRKPVDILVVLYCWCLSYSFCLQQDKFSEELFIKSLERGYVLNHFQFTTLWNASIADENTCKGFSQDNCSPVAIDCALTKIINDWCS